MIENLGRYGHHPDPAIDFCCEVDALQGLAFDREVGLDTSSLKDFALRVNRAMDFRVGGDLWCIKAKDALRALETPEMRASIGIGEASMVTP